MSEHKYNKDKKSKIVFKKEGDSENPNQNKNPEEMPPKKKPEVPKFNFYWIYIGIAALFLGMMFFSSEGGKNITQKELLEMVQKGEVKKIVVVNRENAQVYLTDEALATADHKKNSKDRGFLAPVEGPTYSLTDIGDFVTFNTSIADLQKELPLEKKVVVDTIREKNYDGIINWIFLIALFAGFWFLILRRMSGGGGGGGAGQIFNIGKSKAQLFEKDIKVNVTFKDVAGLDEAKVEVMEIVDFLKNPKKYSNLGGKIPKGALLVGPPGTGKTLLAKAVAGEAEVPFFSLSGSDFVEMFVGVGASRVRDLFRQAKEKAPCIIFIDEIDAVGRARGKSMMQGSNDERESTLNQLLTEMDGFQTDKGVIILAATNRPDILDPALLRPGRFDRQISIDKPDLKGREEIFRVHLKPITVNKDIDAKKLSTQTPGFAGAEIANVCNEAALIAARNGKESVDMQDFQDAIDRVIGGLEKRNKIISPEEKKIVAYHEAGHAVAGWFLEHADPLVKVSIVPRGIAALGYAQYLPKEQFLYSTDQLMDAMCMTLGGRAAEEIFFGKISTGAQNDLERITKMAYAMVTIYGMNERVGNVSFNDTQNEYGFGKPYGEQTAQIIDEEVRTLIQQAYERTKALLIDKKESAEILALELLKKEILFQSDLERLIGKRPFEHKTTYEEFMDTENSNAKDVEVVENVDNKSTAETDNSVKNVKEEEPSLAEEQPPKV